MKKISQNKITFSFFSVVFVGLLLFSGLPAIAQTTAQLEVIYPVLGTGAKITPTSELTEYLKYVFDFGIMIGFFFIFISLVWAGILYFLSPAIPDALAKAKDRISGAISGLLILVLLYLIITTINPYLTIFKMGKLEPVALPEPNTNYPGVYFYQSKDCSGQAVSYTTIVADLGDLNNNVNSIGVVHDADAGDYYMPVIYDIANFWGKCDQISPNKKCSPVENFASSATIHKYDSSPNGDGVYIYRKSLNQVQGKEENKDGGYLKISNSQIANTGSASGYSAPLWRLSFIDPQSGCCTVPREEQDCAKYDEKGDCAERACTKMDEKCYGKKNNCKEWKCPTLENKNISSIWINGNYLVLLIYMTLRDNPYGPWTYCQAYASFTDINKDGPQQIKWDAVRNRGQDPNNIIIIPIKEK